MKFLFSFTLAVTLSLVSLRGQNVTPYAWAVRAYLSDDLLSRHSFGRVAKYHDHAEEAKVSFDRSLLIEPEMVAQLRVGAAIDDV